MSKFLANFFRSRRKVRLRHIFYFGIMLEKHGEAFYRSLSKKYARTDVEDLCSALAEDEIRHRKLLEGTVNRWKAIPFDEKQLAVLKKDLKLRDVFVNPPSPDVSLQEMLRYAIEQENKMEEFYFSFERNFSDMWKLIHLQQLASEESEHAYKLSSLLEKV